jgi:hypothetical protein
MKRDDGRNIRTAALAFGIVFVVVGIVGFIPGITTDTDRLGVFGDVAARLLGLFGVNWLENLAHVLFGVLGIAASGRADRARVYFLGSGVIYVLLFVYGMAIDLEGPANFLGVNDAGNWLHLALGIVMLTIAFIFGGARRRVASAAGR